MKTMILPIEIKSDKKEPVVVYFIVYKKWFKWKYYSYKLFWLLFPYIYLSVADAEMAIKNNILPIT